MVTKNTQSILSSSSKVIALAIGLSLSGGTALATDSVQIPYKELRLFSDIYANIKRNYVEEVDNAKLIEGAIHGMLNQLDPYSTYMTAREYSNLKVDTTGKFGGLGIEIGMDGDYIRISNPIDNTPASRAGLHAGDLIVKIDDTPVKGLKLSEGVDLMRGEIGTQVTLMIIRNNSEPFAVELTRAVIKRNSVKSTLLNDDIAYIRISNFQINTGREVENALGTLTKQIKPQKLTGIILDLRGNPGGILTEAVEVSDVFLPPQKMVVYTKGRRTDSQVQYQTRRQEKYHHVPLVLLVNGRSASASEIVTGALKDHKRATIIGSKSFGKASVQTVHQIDDKRALKLTTARYYTPSGQMIHGSGIAPDITFEPEKTANLDKAEQQKETEQQKKDTPKWLSFKERVQQDPQISHAVEKLKSIIKTAKAGQKTPS